MQAFKLLFHNFKNYIVGGFRPFEKYISQNGNLPQFSGLTQKIFELPPPREIHSKGPNFPLQTPQRSSFNLRYEGPLQRVVVPRASNLLVHRHPPQNCNLNWSIWHVCSQKCFEVKYSRYSKQILSYSSRLPKHACLLYLNVDLFLDLLGRHCTLDFLHTKLAGWMFWFRNLGMNTRGGPACCKIP